MTSLERLKAEGRLERDAMREFRRPTLCVINENGNDVTKDGELRPNGSVTSLSSETELLTESDCGVSITVTPDVNANFTKPHQSSLYFSKSSYLTPSSGKEYDLCELKATANRLKLSTRRPSTVAWQQAHLDSSRDPVLSTFDPSKLQNSADDGFTEERKNRINEALAWLKSELVRINLLLCGKNLMRHASRVLFISVKI